MKAYIIVRTINPVDENSVEIQYGAFIFGKITLATGVSIPSEKVEALDINAFIKADACQKLMDRFKVDVQPDDCFVFGGVTP